MIDEFKFPNGGYNVKICRKREIIDSFDINQEDKEIMLALVLQCENDAIKFLEEGRWASIPYLGNMRVPKQKQKFKELGGVEILEEAKQTLDKYKYDIFKQGLNLSIDADIRLERRYRYMTSAYVNKHKNTYLRFVNYAENAGINDPEGYARFMCYSLIDLSPCISID